MVGAEVCNLAQRSAAAAKEIKALIGEWWTAIGMTLTSQPGPERATAIPQRDRGR